MSDACVTCGREGVWLCSRVDCGSRAKHRQATEDYLNGAKNFKTDPETTKSEPTKSY